MASKESEALAEFFRRGIENVAANPQITIAEMRAFMEHLGDVTAEPGGVDYIEVDANGLQSMWLVPKGSSESRVILCAHGGGYVTNSIYSYRKFYAHLAKHVGCWALIVNYGLAPENPHPGPVNDMASAYQWLLSEAGIAPAHIAIAGDSAGGGLAIATMLRLRELGTPLPAAAMTISPWVDMEFKGESYDTNKDKDALISRQMLGLMSTLLLGENGDRQDPLVNPLFADLGGLPPVNIQVSEDEALLDDSRSLAEALRKAGVDVTLDITPEMQHIFPILAGAAPEADEALARSAAWVRPKLDL